MPDPGERKSRRGDHAKRGFQPRGKIHPGQRDAVGTHASEDFELPSQRRLVRIRREHCADSLWHKCLQRTSMRSKPLPVTGARTGKVNEHK